MATETPDEGVAAMVAAWLRLRDGAPDPHTQTAGPLMLATTNEQVSRINDATQAVRQTRRELGDGASYRLPGGREARFHVGDLVLIRRNDRHQQAVTGDVVLNGYRGVVTAVTAKGVAWRGATRPPNPRANCPRHCCRPGCIAQVGLELGCVLTAHKAEGLTVGGTWERPDGTRNHGSVLVYAPGLDNPGLYVSLSRDKGQVIVFGARAEHQGEREELVYGPPATSKSRPTGSSRPWLSTPPLPSRPRTTGRSSLTRPGSGRPSGPGTTAEAASSVPIPGPESATVTDVQRQQWRELRQGSIAARRGGDQEAHQDIQAQRQTFMASLGPERVEMLQRESRDELRRRVQDTTQRLERQRLIAQWHNRVHSPLTDTELTHGIRHAEQKQAEHRAAADRARQQLVEREPAVEAGRVPRVTQLDAELHRLGVNAERQGTVEEIERRWNALGAQAADVAERAVHKEFDAERAHWWQPGRREQLQAEAAADNALSQRLLAHAAELAHPVAELQRQLGGPGVWTQARELAERAKASYLQDRQRAHEADQRVLDRLHDRADSLDTAAREAATRRAELLAEQLARFEQHPHKPVLVVSCFPSRSRSHGVAVAGVVTPNDHRDGVIRADQAYGLGDVGTAGLCPGRGGGRRSRLLPAPA